MPDILEVNELNLQLNNNKVIDNLSFSVKKGEVFGIIGPNGAGKTILFKCLLGLLPYSGEIKWEKKLKIGYVPQKISINADLPLTVLDFFHFKTKSSESISEALKAVGIKIDQAHEHHLSHHILNRRIGVLSGGELQKIFVAWALIGEPDVLLFDEPTAGVDVGGEETIYQLLSKINKERGTTILLISHDLHIIYEFANTVLCLNKEKICLGDPMTELNQHNIKRLYGESVKLHD